MAELVLVHWDYPRTQFKGIGYCRNGEMFDGVALALQPSFVTKIKVVIKGREVDTTDNTNNTHAIKSINSHMFTDSVAKTDECHRRKVIPPNGETLVKACSSIPQIMIVDLVVGTTTSSDPKTLYSSKKLIPHSNKQILLYLVIRF